VAGRHVWEHGNLAQKNLTILAAAPDTWLVLPFVISALRRGQPDVLELRVPKQLEGLTAELVARRPPRPIPPIPRVPSFPPFGTPGDGTADRGVVEPELDDCGHAQQPEPASSDAADRVVELFDETPVVTFKPGARSRARLPLPIGPTPLGLRLHVNPGMRPGASGVIDLVQLDSRQRPVGGIAVEVRVTS
jgi:hypothetical protein